ncbi:hypothetical protein, partial [Flavobacterium cauense]
VIADNVPWLYEVVVSLSRNITNIPKRMNQKSEFLSKKCEHKLFQKITKPRHFIKPLLAVVFIN